MSGSQRLAEVLHRRPTSPTPTAAIGARPIELLPESVSHLIELKEIERRLAKLESQMTNQNRLLLIGVVALVGDILKTWLHP